MNSTVTVDKTVIRNAVKFARYNVHGSSTIFGASDRPAAASKMQHIRARTIVTEIIGDNAVTVDAITGTAGYRSFAAMCRAAVTGTDLSPCRELAGTIAAAYGPDAWNTGRYLCGTLVAWCHEIDASRVNRAIRAVH